MSAVTPVSNSNVSALTSNGTNSADTTSNPSQALSQNDFLKLLVAQMQYQDPMNPQSDTQMAAQMAQFTALQQSTQMSSSLSMLQANNLVGNTVTVQVDPSSNQVTSGVVSGVTLSSGSPQILVNGTPYNLSQVLSMTPASAAATANNP